jgi:hypothetical protein
MKIQNILRIQAVAIGFAGFLAVASSAQAQEITNTEWPDTTSATATVQATPTPAANDSSTPAANSGAQAIVIQETVVPQWPAFEIGAIATLLVFFTMVALYKRAAARRANRDLQSRVRRVNDRVAAS